MRRASAATAIALVATLAASAPAAASIFGTLFAGQRPAALGTRDGRLTPCPDCPNCVSSQAADARHAIAPLAFRGEPAAAQAALATAIRAMPGHLLAAEQPGYLHAEFASAIMGFVDDAEFAVDGQSQVIHVRSAARLGYSDFGVNRRRIETLRATFAAMNP